MADDYLYPFDPTGKLVSNLVSNEPHLLSQTAWSDYFFIVPKFAPYFRKSLKAYGPSGRLLVEGVDYFCTHWFHAASHQVADGVYGSISFTDRTLAGQAKVTYQTIGGAWAFNDQALLQRLVDSKLNPRITTWEQVVDLPFQFPPIDHEWDVKDLTGMSEVVVAVDRITESLKEASPTDIAGHINDHNNPHQVTADQLDVYKKLATDLLLSKKLDLDSAAADAVMFGGQTVAWWKTFIGQNTGVSADQSLDQNFTQLISVVDAVRIEFAKPVGA